MLLILLVASVVGPVVTAAYLAHVIATVPAADRGGLTPASAWLLLVPGFNLVWLFALLAGIAGAFRRHFEGRGATEPGDYGRRLGVWLAVVIVTSLLPCLWPVTLPAGITLMLLLVSQFRRYGRLIRIGGPTTHGFPMRLP